MESISHRPDGAFLQKRTEKSGPANEGGAGFDISDSSILKGKDGAGPELSLIPPPGKASVQAAQAVGSREEPAADHVTEVTDITFDDALKNAETPVLVNFFNPT
jgi:hypothetical protein